MTPTRHPPPSLLGPLALLAVAAMAAQTALACIAGLPAGDGARLFAFAASCVLVPFAWAGRRSATEESAAFASASIVYWLVVAAAGFLLPEGPASAAALALATAASASGAAAAARSASGLRPVAPALAAATVLVFYACGAWWSTGHTHPDVARQLSHGYLHADGLYITSVSAMVRRFGVVSLGLDGLTTLRWHFLTASLLSAAGKCAAVPQLTAHAVFYPLFAPPLLILGLAAFAARFTRAGAAARATVCAALVSWMLPVDILGKYAAWDPIGSETFGTTLALFFLGALRVDAPPERPPRAGAALMDAFWVLALTLGKISVGFLAAVWLTMRAIDAGGRRIRDYAPLIPVWTAFAVCLPFILGQSSRSEYRPLWFLLAQIGYPTKWPTFFLVHWLPLWIGIGATALRRKDLLAALREDAYVTTLLVPAWLVGVFSFNLTIRGGSGVYFSMLAPVLAIPWACGRLLEAARERPRAGRAALAGALGAAAAFQFWPDARGAWEHLVRGRIAEAKSPQAARAVEDILALRGTVARSPRCALYASNAALAASALNRDVRCFEVPLYLTASVERPLVLSWEPYACRTTPAGFWWGHPQRREQPPETPTDAQLCEAARRSGLDCVVSAAGGTPRRLDCPGRLLESLP